MANKEYGVLLNFGKNSHGQIGIKIDKEFIYNQDNFTGIPTMLPMFKNVFKISCGVQHTGFITYSGEVFMMGNGSFGKLGTGDTEDRHEPTQIYGITNVKDIQCGNDHTIALGNKSVYTWGSGSMGRLGAGKTGALLKPTMIHIKGKPTNFRSSMPELIESVYAGGASSGAISESGSLYTWGYNKYGQLGINSLADQFQPVRVTFFESVGGIKSFSIGDRHMAAIDSNGEIYTWGMNEDNQLGDGSSFNKHVPTMIRVKPFQKFTKIRCGGAYTAAVSENGSFWCWGTFVDQYSSTQPKMLIENSVLDFDCSSDCGKHVIVRTLNNQVYTFGWNRYGQAANEEESFADTVPVSKCEIITGFPSQVSTGSYHSALLYKNPSELLSQLIWCGKLSQIHEIYMNSSSNDIKSHNSYKNHNGDSLLHLIAKKNFKYHEISFMNGQKDDLSLNFKTLNLNDNLPPFFYNAELLDWPIQKTSSIKSDITFIKSINGDNCLHYYAKKGSIKEFEIAIGHGADHKLRNKENQRPFDLLDNKLSFDIKTQFKIYDIGLVFEKEYIDLARRLKVSLEENLITSCLIDSKSNEYRNCYGYIFFVSSKSLVSQYHVDFLLSFVSKSPMVSIWAEKTKITDPTLESCIFRSQLVDFSSYPIYNDSFSVLMEGVYNMFAMKEKKLGSGDDDDDDDDTKQDVDTIPHSVSGSTESIFISFDPNNQKNFQPLFDFLKSKDITIVPREKKVISSWAVVVIISEAGFSPLIRDEISLAENRGKPLIPIYYSDKILDEASRYTFSNSPKILFNNNGFDQLLLLIKLHFNLIHHTENLLKLKNKK